MWQNQFSQTLLMYTLPDHFQKKNGKSNWVVVYGDFGQAYMLKAQFIGAYLETLFKRREQVMTSNVDINHCKSYYEIDWFSSCVGHSSS
jgi:hypothetical protein